jgi:hypothetical protein
VPPHEVRTMHHVALGTCALGLHPLMAGTAAACGPFSLMLVAAQARRHARSERSIHREHSVVTACAATTCNRFVLAM